MVRYFPVLAALVAACSSTTTTTPAPSGEVPVDERPADQSATTPPDGPVAFTASEVQELFATKCARCHSGTSSTPLDLRDFEVTTIGAAVAGGNAKCADSAQQVRIVAGDREASLLWHKVKGTQDCGDAMPPPGKGTKLTATELERLGLYIDGLK